MADIKQKTTMGVCVGLVALVATVGCGPVSPQASRSELRVDDRPAVCHGWQLGDDGLCPRVSEDGKQWLAGNEIRGFERQWGIEARIVVVSRDPDPAATHSGVVVTHEKTLGKSAVDPGTEVTIGGPETTTHRGAPPFEVTGATSGVFEDGKGFECGEDSVCDELKSLLGDPEIEERGMGYELTLSYQSDIHGPLLLQAVREHRD